MLKDYYAILGVTQDAEDVVISAAHKALAKKYHPDVWTGEASQSDELMKLINEAYTVLSSQEKRNAYDEQYNQQFSRGDFDAHSDGAEETEEVDWANLIDLDSWSVVEDYHPEADVLRNELSLISSKLALQFQIILLATQSAKDAKTLASKLKSDFLFRFFGSSETLQKLALLFIWSGKTEVAIEINKAVRVLGENDSDLIKKKIMSKYLSDDDIDAFESMDFEHLESEIFITPPKIPTEADINQNSVEGTIHWNCKVGQAISKGNCYGHIDYPKLEKTTFLVADYDILIKSLLVESGDSVSGTDQNIGSFSLRISIGT